MLTELSAANRGDLFATLEKIDIAVPLRTEGRRSFHCENWSICRGLSTLAQTDLLTYPLICSKRERPDFLLSMGDSFTGIEVTEAIPEQYAQYCALQEREFPDAILDPGHFHYRSKRLSVDQMRRLLSQNRLTSDGWAGDQPEQDWALFMRDRINAKSLKLRESAFCTAMQNWLLIYDNLPLPSVNLVRAVSYLRPLIAKTWQEKPSFEIIAIECGRRLVVISGKGLKVLSINDIWWNDIEAA